MKEIIFAGFGGQGVLTGGLIIAYTAAKKGLNMVWLPSYGPTMRGGKANCTVKYGETPDEVIGSPAMEGRRRSHRNERAVSGLSQLLQARL